MTSCRPGLPAAGDLAVAGSVESELADAAADEQLVIEDDEAPAADELGHDLVPPGAPRPRA
jgi:hypothetical protein